MKGKRNRYETNKAAKVGVEITCPSCGIVFVKRSYQQAFCCGACKDEYHNQRRKNNGYFRRYNINNPERLERIGVGMERDMDLYLGDCECESMAQITMARDAAQFENIF